MIDTANLPDDVEALKAMILASHARIADKDAEIMNKNALIERKEDRIQRLEKLVADFRRALFGARSEKVAAEQYELALEDIETAMAVIQVEDDAEKPFLPAPYAGLRLAGCRHERHGAMTGGRQNDNPCTPHVFLTGIRIIDDLFKPFLIGRQNRERDSCTHPQDSHSPAAKGIPNRTQMLDAIH